MRAKGSKGGFSGLKPIRVKLFSAAVTTTSAAATALKFTTNIALDTTHFPELTNFGVIYDELSMKACKMYYYFGNSVPGVASTASNAVAAILFDPSAGAPTNSYSLLEESYSTGPLLNFVGNNGGVGQVVTRADGRLPFIRAKAPALAPITSEDCPGSAWVALDGATAAIMAVFQAYCDPLAGVGQSTFTYIAELDVELRLRT
jgi:hypothetical protein